LFIPSEETILRVEALSPRILAAPGAWVDHFLLTHLRLLLPFKSDLLDFKTFCLAVRCRVMFRQFPKWTSFGASKLISSSVKWFFHGPCVSFRNSHNDLISSGFISSRGIFKNKSVNDSASSLDSKQMFQGKLYFALFYVAVSDKFSRELNRRLARWKLPQFNYYLECMRVSSVLHACNCPQRIFNALAVTWLNGWVTERRRQKLSSFCPFCPLWLSCDSIEHFSVCKYFHGLARHFLYLPRINSTRTFLVWVDAPPPILCKRALHVYLCKSVFDAVRHGNKAPGFSIYRANLMKFATKFPNFIHHYTTTINDDLGILLHQ
jgi:hypothetical protein